MAEVDLFEIELGSKLILSDPIIMLPFFRTPDARELRSHRMDDWYRPRKWTGVLARVRTKVKNSVFTIQ